MLKIEPVLLAFLQFKLAQYRYSLPLSLREDRQCQTDQNKCDTRSEIPPHRITKHDRRSHDPEHRLQILNTGSRSGRNRPQEMKPEEKASNANNETKIDR